MNGDLEKKRARAYEMIDEYIQRRIDWYNGKISSSPTLKRLLSKGVVMFAARGVTTADEFVEEAFHALESSSEETVMGGVWQAILGEIADNTLDTGDMTTVRDGVLYVCELKSQTNTVNYSSLPQELRDLRDKCEKQRAFRTGTKRKVEPAYCVLRSNKSIDEVRVYEPTDHGRDTRDDLTGFEYRYLEGAGFWQWLIGVKSEEGLINDPSKLDVKEIVDARKKCLTRLTMEMHKALRENGLDKTMADVIKLKGIVCGKDPKTTKKGLPK